MKFHYNEIRSQNPY